MRLKYPLSETGGNMKIISAILVNILVFLASATGVSRYDAVMKETPGEVGRNSEPGVISVHDPSVFRADGSYYVYGSHLAAGKSQNLKDWQLLCAGVCDSADFIVPEGETLRSALKEPLAWTDALQLLRKTPENELQTAVWAPSVIYNPVMKKYCCYACSSVWGTPHSVIWFATSDSPEGPFTYQKSLIYSGFNRRTNAGFIPKNQLHYLYTNVGDLIKQGVYTRSEIEKQPWFKENGNYDISYGRCPNAIDPTAFSDADGGLWLVYGSFSGGIYVMPLVEETGLPDYGYMKKTKGYDIYFGKLIAKTNEETEGSGEGPFIVYCPESRYYYFFLTYGGLGATDRYQIREFRSTAPDGDYLDAAGNKATDAKSSGLQILGNYKFSFDNVAYLSGGHSSCLIDEDGSMYQVYHTRFNDGVGYFRTAVHPMAVTKNGWALMLPLEYDGESHINGNSAIEITGSYEALVLPSEPLQTDIRYDWNNIEETVQKPSQITLAEDGSIMHEGKSAGSWSAEDGYLSINFEGVNYTGVLRTQAKDGKAVTVITACADSNATLWAVADI